MEGALKPASDCGPKPPLQLRLSLEPSTSKSKQRRKSLNFPQKVSKNRATSPQTKPWTSHRRSPTQSVTSALVALMAPKYGTHRIKHGSSGAHYAYKSKDLMSTGSEAAALPVKGKSVDRAISVKAVPAPTLVPTVSKQAISDQPCQA